MKKYINNVLATFLLIDGLYFLYSFIIILSAFLNTFDPSQASLYVIVVGAYIGTMMLFILAGIGLFKNKNWAIICGWIAALLPQLVKLIAPLAHIPLQNNYVILIINVLMLIYLSTQWGKLTTN